MELSKLASRPVTQGTKFPFPSGDIVGVESFFGLGIILTSQLVDLVNMAFSQVFSVFKSTLVVTLLIEVKFD